MREGPFDFGDVLVQAFIYEISSTIATYAMMSANSSVEVFPSLDLKRFMEMQRI